MSYDTNQDQEEKTKSFAGWGISTLIHIFILIILTTIVFSKNFLIEEAPILITTVEVKDDPIEKEDYEDNIKIEIEETIDETEIINEINVMSELEEINDVEISSEEPIDMENIKGRSDAISNSDYASDAAFKFVGIGSTSSGPFGRTPGGDKRRIIKSYGPNAKEATSSLDAALRWLMIHQSPNGQWDSDEYNINCNDDPKCEPGKNVNGADEALTGYAVLCFLGAGYDHKNPSRYRKVVKKGINWLISQQSDNGQIGKRNYEHPIATMALAEAYAMTNDGSIKEYVQKALDIVIKRQIKTNEEYKEYLGWSYTAPNISRIDSSVSGWNVMCIKSAKAGGLDVVDSLKGSKRWVELAWKAANPSWETLDQYSTSIFPYTWNGITNTSQKNHLSFIGALCAVFLGYQRNDVVLESLMNDLNKRWFDNEKYKNNSYCLYYASLASFQAGGTHWLDFWGHPENGYIPWLISTQLHNGCENGTWKHEKENWHGWDTSPILTHVYKTLSLQVAFRYKTKNAGF